MSSLIKLASLAALQAYATTTDTVYVQKRSATGNGGDGYEGVFEWQGGVTATTNIANDPQCGIWVPSSVASGGVWKRVFDGEDIQAIWFGVKADGTADDTAALNGCVTAAAAVVTGGVVQPAKAIVLPAGTMIVSPLTLTGAKAIRGQGVGLTTVKFKTKSPAYAANTAFLQLDAGCILENLSISCDDSSFDLCDPVMTTANNVRIRNVEVTGRFKHGILVNGSANADLDTIHVTSTNSASYRGVQIVSATGGSLSNCLVEGALTDHIVSIDSSTGFNADFVRSAAQTTTGFGVSLTFSTGCTLSQSSAKDSHLEAFQMTGCTDCAITSCYAEWSSTAGADFGASIDGCVRCEVSHCHFNNSYKSAVAIASDTAGSRNCLVSYNQAHNCGTRATALPVFTQYSNASSGNYVSDNNEFLGNTSDIDSGLTVGSFYAETIGGTGTITNSRVRSNHFTGAGTYTVQYALQPKTKLWRDDFIAWNPSPVPTTVGTTAPAFTINTAHTKILVDGDEAEAYLDFTVTSLGTGANGGQLLVPLPADYPGATDFAGIAYGADIGSTDLAVRGIVNGGNLFLTLFNPALTAANGAFNLYPVINTSQRFVMTVRYRLAH